MHKKNIASLLAAAALCAFAALPAAAAPAKGPGNIVFVGDSITNGGSYLAGPVPSYRYQVFKAFVDNDVRYSPMGMTRGAAKNVDVSKLTPDYRGKKFDNVSEAAASGRAYQYSGHSAEKMVSGNNYKADPGTAFPPANRGPVTLKLGQPNPFVPKKEAKDSFYDGTTLKKYTGDTYKSLYGNKKVDTLCVMIGINDLYDAWEPNEKIAEHVRGIVSAYQKHNPAVRVHVFELLPTAGHNGTGTHGKNNYAPYNKYLRGVAKSWSKGKSVVTCDAVAQGFYAEDGSMCDTNRGAHPNAQGELIVAGNIARVLGIGQRTAGLKRRSAENLDSQTAFAAAGNAVEAQAGDRKFTPPAAGTKGWKVDSKKRLAIDTESAGSSDIRLFRTGAKSAKGTPFTVSVKVKMGETSRADNFLGVFCGNGSDQVGQLFIGEAGIYWNDTKTLLYGSKSADSDAKRFTKKAERIRVAWKPEGETAGGFYVWLGDQLIGEALSGSTAPAVVSAYKNAILIGDCGNAFSVNAVVEEISFDEKTAWAPENAEARR